MPQFKFNTISRTDIQGSPGGAQMINAIEYDGPNHLLITGCPGSGKTTVSIMRAERLIILRKKVLLITFQHLLKTSLVNMATENLKPHIVTFYRWFSNKFKYLEKEHDENIMIELMKNWNGVDEIILDEGQDFEARIYRALLKKCTKMSVGADNAQKVYHKGLKVQEIQNEVQKIGQIKSIPLQYNYRNTYEIYNFARNFLPFNERVNNSLAMEKLPKGKGVKPTLFLVPNHDTRLNQLNVLLADAGDRNIAVLVFGKEEVQFYYDAINKMGINCSMNTSDDHVGNEIENVLITTLAAAKGLEFQVVIMPEMESAMIGQYQTEEHYYISCTRAKENLYLISQGEILPTCFRKFDVTSYQLIKPAATAAPKKGLPLNLGVDDLPF
jgi:superfamily I DNA/RNA helicase